jgi:FkbM family methyltransferase
MILDLKSLISKYNLNIEGVIHVGANEGEEIQKYVDCNILNAVFFEPRMESYTVLRRKAEQYKTMKTYNFGLGDKEEILTLYRANNGMSSSFLKPKLHKDQYPGIIFENEEKMFVKTLDSFELFKGYNFLNMDVQGFELSVLKGGTKTLQNINYIMLEVNRAELYENCVQINELNSFLTEYNFEEKEIDWEGNTWGDAFYIRK